MGQKIAVWGLIIKMPRVSLTLTVILMPVPMSNEMHSAIRAPKKNSKFEVFRACILRMHFAQMFVENNCEKK